MNRIGITVQFYASTHRLRFILYAFGLPIHAMYDISKNQKQNCISFLCIRSKTSNSLEPTKIKRFVTYARIILVAISCIFGTQ